MILHQSLNNKQHVGLKEASLKPKAVVLIFQQPYNSQPPSKPYYQAKEEWRGRLKAITEEAEFRQRAYKAGTGQEGVNFLKLRSFGKESIPCPTGDEFGLLAEGVNIGIKVLGSLRQLCHLQVTSFFVSFALGGCSVPVLILLHFHNCSSIYLFNCFLFICSICLIKCFLFILPGFFTFHIQS